MIQVVYYHDLNRVTVTGHAGSAEKGHDLVCASASMLAYTLAANVASMADAGQVSEPIMDMNEGDTVISCAPKSHLKAAVSLVFDAICVGFELLSGQHPEYISFEIRQ